MKFKTLTSTLVLSFILAGSQAIAMDEEDKSSSAPAIQSSVHLTDQQELEKKVAEAGVTVTDLLSASVRCPDLIEQLAVARKAKDLVKIKRLTDLLLQEAAENPLPATAKNEKWSFSWDFSWLFGKSEEKASDFKPSETSPVNTLPDSEKIAKESVTPTPVKSEKIGQESETPSNSSPSLLSRLNPLNWIWGAGAPEPTTLESAVKEFVPLDPESDPVKEPQNEAKTDNQ